MEDDALQALSACAEDVEGRPIVAPQQSQGRIVEDDAKPGTKGSASMTSLGSLHAVHLNNVESGRVSV